MITALNGEALIIFLALQQALSYSLSFHPHPGLHHFSPTSYKWKQELRMVKQLAQ